MATPAQLMDTLADALRIPLATIVDHDRKLTKAGLRSKNGRGRSVATATTLDAARLLTSILAGPRATEAASAVERYNLAVVDKARSSEGAFAATGLPDLTRLSTRHSFVEAIAAVITSAAVGSIAALTDKGAPPRIEIFAFMRATRGRIRFTGIADARTVVVEYAHSGKEPGSTTTAGTPPQVEGGDFEQSSRITDQTIYAIAALFKRENYND